LGINKDAQHTSNAKTFRFESIWTENQDFHEKLPKWWNDFTLKSNTGRSCKKNAIYHKKNEGWAWQAHRQKHRRYLLSQLNDF